MNRKQNQILDELTDLVYEREVEFVRWYREMEAFRSFEGEVTNWDQIPEYVRGIDLGTTVTTMTIAIPARYLQKKEELVLLIANLLRAKAIDIYGDTVRFSKRENRAIGILKEVSPNQIVMVFFDFQMDGNMMNVDICYSDYRLGNPLDKCKVQSRDILNRINEIHFKLNYFKREIQNRLLNHINNADKKFFYPSASSNYYKTNGLIPMDLTRDEISPIFEGKLSRILISINRSMTPIFLVLLLLIGYFGDELPGYFDDKRFVPSLFIVIPLIWLITRLLSVHSLENDYKRNYAYIYLICCRDRIVPVTPSFFILMRYGHSASTTPNAKSTFNGDELDSLSRYDYNINFYSRLFNALNEIRNRLETLARME